MHPGICASVLVGGRRSDDHTFQGIFAGIRLIDCLGNGITLYRLDIPIPGIIVPGTFEKCILVFDIFDILILDILLSFLITRIIGSLVRPLFVTRTVIRLNLLALLVVLIRSFVFGGLVTVAFGVF